MYLKGIPTSGNDLVFVLTGALIGVVLGAVAAVLMGVQPDGRGNAILSAGIPYLAFWIGVFGARLAFAWAATNSTGFAHQLFVFSYQHEITGAAAWTAFFILQAIMMVGVRTVIVGARVLLSWRASRFLEARAA